MGKQLRLEKLRCYALHSREVRGKDNTANMLFTHDDATAAF
jgi:hypothetical protein